MRKKRSRPDTLKGDRVGLENQARGSVSAEFVVAIVADVVILDDVAEVISISSVDVIVEVIIVGGVEVGREYVVEDAVAMQIVGNRVEFLTLCSRRIVGVMLPVSNHVVHRAVVPDVGTNIDRHSKGVVREPIRVADGAAIERSMMPRCADTVSL